MCGCINNAVNCQLVTSTINCPWRISERLGVQCIGGATRGAKRLPWHICCSTWTLHMRPYNPLAIAIFLQTTSMVSATDPISCKYDMYVFVWIENKVFPCRKILAPSLVHICFFFSHSPICHPRCLVPCLVVPCCSYNLSRVKQCNLSEAQKLGPVQDLKCILKREVFKACFCAQYRWVLGVQYRHLGTAVACYKVSACTL